MTGRRVLWTALIALAVVAIVANVPAIQRVITLRAVA